MNSTPFRALLLDIGGVLLSKGWGTASRKAAAERFGLDFDEMQDRHEAIFHTYEEGRITLSEYLQRIVFYRERAFTEEQFKAFIYAQSHAYPDMLAFTAGLKADDRREGVLILRHVRSCNQRQVDSASRAGYGCIESVSRAKRHVRRGSRSRASGPPALTSYSSR